MRSVDSTLIVSVVALAVALVALYLASLRPADIEIQPLHGAGAPKVDAWNGPFQKRVSPLRSQYGTAEPKAQSFNGFRQTALSR